MINLLLLYSLLFTFFVARMLFLILSAFCSVGNEKEGENFTEATSSFNYNTTKEDTAHRDSSSWVPSYRVLNGAVSINMIQLNHLSCS